MAKIRSVTTCKTPSDFEQAAKSQDGYIENGGDGLKIYKDSKSLGYGELHNRHKKDLPKGTRCDLIKALLKLGFVVAPILFAWVLM